MACALNARVRPRRVLLLGPEAWEQSLCQVRYRRPSDKAAIYSQTVVARPCSPPSLKPVEEVDSAGGEFDPTLCC